MMKVTSQVKLYPHKIRQLTKAQITALEQTAESVHTEVVQAQVMPRDTGALQNESTFVDFSDSAKGKVSLVSSTPYARRLYFHPEYHFRKTENPYAKGKWLADWAEPPEGTGKNSEHIKETYKQIYRRLTGI
jgi:hypothetical protein